MTAVDEKASSEHHRLVGCLIDWIEKEGFKVKCADFGKYTTCDKWKQPSDQHVPDARGLRSNPDLLCMGESKTTDDIDNDQTRSQFKEFSNYMMPDNQGKDCPFYIAIPKGSEESLRKVLNELDLLDKPHVKWQSF